MAVVHPLYYSSGNLRKVSSSQLSDQQDYGTKLWGKAAYRGTDLSYQAAGNLRRIQDTRDIASAERSNVTSFLGNDATLGDTVNEGASTDWDYINQSTGTFSITGLNYPVYRTSSGNFQIMSYQDVVDTFVDQIVSNLVDGTDRGGLYSISTNDTTYADHTLLNASPIFTDQQFNKSIHGGVTTTTEIDILPLASTDLPVDIESYYLWRKDEEVIGSFERPLYWTGTNFKRYTAAEWETFLGTLLGYISVNETGHRVRYEVEATGTDTYAIPSYITKATMGTAMVNTTLASQVRINDQDGANAYRSQRLPTGASETNTTYTLKIYRF